MRSELSSQRQLSTTVSVAESAGIWSTGVQWSEGVWSPRSQQGGRTHNPRHNHDTHILRNAKVKRFGTLKPGGPERTRETKLTSPRSRRGSGHKSPPRVPGTPWAVDSLGWGGRRGHMVPIDQDVPRTCEPHNI